MVKRVQEEIEEGNNEDRKPGDARLGRPAQFRPGENHDHHSPRSSSASHAHGHAPELSVMDKDRLPHVPKNGGSKNKLCPVANGSKIQDLRGKKSRSKRRSGSTQSMNFRLAGLTKTLASVNNICQRRSRVVFGRRRRLHREQGFWTRSNDA